jgi:Rieske Fe-S protein
VQPSAGEVKAFSATCPHQGVTVAVPQNGTITCPGHGSQFTAATGAVTRGPSTTGLTAVTVKVNGAAVVLA